MNSAGHQHQIQSRYQRLFPHSETLFSLRRRLQIQLKFKSLFNTFVKVTAPLNPLVLQHLNKVGKGACQALANAQIQRSTNIQLLAALEQKKQRANRSNEHYGFARVMDFDVIKERQAEFYKKPVGFIFSLRA
jgi:hypothetical protein